MRVAFACEDDSGMESLVSSKFARAPYLAIVEVDDEGRILEAKHVANPGATAGGGAGIKAVQKLVDEHIDVVVAGAFGPNALAALEELGIRRMELAGTTIRQAILHIKST